MTQPSRPEHGISCRRHEIRRTDGRSSHDTYNFEVGGYHG